MTERDASPPTVCTSVENTMKRGEQQHGSNSPCLSPRMEEDFDPFVVAGTTVNPRQSSTALRISVSVDSDSDSDHSGFLHRGALQFQTRTRERGSLPAAGIGDAGRSLRSSDATNTTATTVDGILARTSGDYEEEEFQILPDDDEAGDDAGGATNDRPLTPPTNEDGEEVILTSPVESPQQTLRRSPNTATTMLRRQLNRLYVGTSTSPPVSPARTPVHRRAASLEDSILLRTPLAGPFRAIRARALAAYKSNVPVEAPNVVEEEWLQDDGSSSEESSESDNYISSDDESGTYDETLDDDESDVDFAAIVPMPNSFLGIAPDRFEFLDRNLVKAIGEQNIATCAQDHKFFARALMQLLAERDAVGVEDDVHDFSNVIKTGPLKKRTTRGMWVVKFVEIRRGNLSYFADDARRIDSIHRKTIHLRKRTSGCTPVIEANGNNDIFVFKVTVEGLPKIQFMAQSEEERQGWIRAINQAMIGDVEGSQHDTPVDLSMYQSGIDSYRTVTNALKQVQSRADYLVAVDSLLYRKTASSALRVPMSWLRQQVIEHLERKEDDERPAARVKSNIAENWKSLSSTSVNINGHLIDQNTSFSANRILGTLTRCILEHDQVEVDDEIGHTLKRQSRDASPPITELEAASYARSILVSALRGELNGQIKEAVEHLVQNDFVAKVESVKSDCLRIDVSFAGEDYMGIEQKPNDMSGWLMTRPSTYKAWKSRYFVVSEGVLSFFAEAEPRPYGLRGQIVLNKCTMKTLDDNILTIEVAEEQRYLQFLDRGQLLKWRTVMERAAVVPRGPACERENRRGKLGQIVSTVNHLITATDTGVKAGKRAMRVMKEAPKAGLKKARGMLANIRYRGQTTSDDDRRNTTEAMVIMSTRGIQRDGEKKDLKVQAVTELNSVFRVMPVPSRKADDPLL